MESPTPQSRSPHTAEVFRDSASSDAGFVNVGQPFVLSDEDIDSFVAMWHDEFGETLSVDEARFEATRLLEYFASLMKAFGPRSYVRDRNGRMVA